MISSKFLDFKILKSQIDLSLEKIVNYYSNLEKLSIQPNVKPGFLREKISTEIPVEPTSFEEVLSELETHVFPNLVHWNHPSFFGYFPSSITHTSITSELIITSLGTPNFNWHVSPASHEVEWLLSDWMVEILDLPSKFLFKNGGAGGITPSMTDNLFLSVNAAKYKMCKALNLDIYDQRRLKFVGYFPETNKSWAQKALNLKDIHIHRMLKVRFNEETQSYEISPEELAQTIKDDINSGLIPLWYGAQFGSTDCGVFDDLEKIGPILKQNNIFVNVDAAYSGMFFFCPEYRVKGIEYANAISFNWSKCGLSGLTGNQTFFDDKENLIQSTGNISNLIYKSEHSNPFIDYKDMSVGFGRRMTAIKLYILLKTIGVKGYQEYVKLIISRGKIFEDLISSDFRFELFCKPVLGLVTFRVKPLDGKIDKDSFNKINLLLAKKMQINTEDGFVSTGTIDGNSFLRFVSGNPLTETQHIIKLFEKLKNCVNSLSDD